MSRKLHKFQTVAEYQAYSASTEYTTPCVALIVDTNVIYYDYGDNKPQVDLSEFKVESQETSVGGDYYGKSAITKINYIPSSITSLYNAFGFYRSIITAPEIPSGVTNMYSTFTDCTSLVSVPNIPSGVTDMEYTFLNCSNLVNVPPIPSGVTNIRYTFWDCRSLKKLTFLHTTPPTYNDTLKQCPIETIYVPDSSLEDYRTATGWSQFASKIKPLSSKPTE